MATNSNRFLVYSKIASTLCNYNTHTQPKLSTVTSLCLGRREVSIGNMDGRWILFSWEKDLSLEVVPSL